MKINAGPYAGEPFKIVGRRLSGTFSPLFIVGWTRSPCDDAELGRIARNNGLDRIEYLTVRNRRTGDA